MVGVYPQDGRLRILLSLVLILKTVIINMSTDRLESTCPLTNTHLLSVNSDGRWKQGLFYRYKEKPQLPKKETAVSLYVFYILLTLFYKRSFRHVLFPPASNPSKDIVE